MKPTKPNKLLESVAQANQILRTISHDGLRRAKPGDGIKELLPSERKILTDLKSDDISYIRTLVKPIKRIRQRCYSFNKKGS